MADHLVLGKQLVFFSSMGNIISPLLSIFWFLVLLYIWFKQLNSDNVMEDKNSDLRDTFQSRSVIYDGQINKSKIRK